MFCLFSLLKWIKYSHGNTFACEYKIIIFTCCKTNISFLSSNVKIKLIISKLIGKALQRLEELLKILNAEPFTIFPHRILLSRYLVLIDMQMNAGHVQSIGIHWKTMYNF